MVATFGAQAAWAGSTFPLTSALLRSPQVPVHGDSLQNYLDAVGENIQVGRDQVVVELLTSGSSSSSYTLQIELGPTSGHVVGIYDGHRSSPTLVPVFPAFASAGWSALLSFRSSPTRVVVSLFNENGSFQGSATTLGVSGLGIGFYVEGSAGPVYSQDSRNAGGASQVLFYGGTGVNLGSAWMAAQAEPAAPGDRDFADTILFLAAQGVCVICPPFTYPLTPVRRATWGDLKLHFH